MISVGASRRRGGKRPWERKIPVRPGPSEPMSLDDALERFIDQWLVFKITDPDDQALNHRGLVMGHGGPETAVREIARRVSQSDPSARLLIQYSTGRPIRTGQAARRAIEEYFLEHDFDDWYDVWR